MEKYDIYKDISLRSGGDIYIGVVGPVRTGKSTFITRFMQNLVIPNISNKLQKKIATDEMPQSADGKTIMTTQPKFVPANAVKIQLKNKTTANVRLVDCVGYFVDGAVGHEEGDKPRLVKTPWSDKEIPFEKAAEIGTKKVIEEYSTIGLVVTTDGSIGDIDRSAYLKAEERVIKELKSINKPFVIILNSKNPKGENAKKISVGLEEKYQIPVIALDVLNMTDEDIIEIMEGVLLQFPMLSFNINMPKWLRSLPSENKIISKICQNLKSASERVEKISDYAQISSLFDDDDDVSLTVKELKLGEGVVDFDLLVSSNLYFKALSDECGEEIVDDYNLMAYIKTFSQEKKKYMKIKSALENAEESGYGVVLPTIDEMDLEEPVLVKQGGRYGVKLKASAPSLHIMKVDVATEVAPIVGTEKQGEDLINFIMSKFEGNPSDIWATNMFGKSLYDLVNEGLQSKITALPNEVQNKMRKTLTRMVNENRGGMICILL